MDVPRNVVCPDCKGRGGVRGSGVLCTGCNGSGTQTEMMEIGPGNFMKTSFLCQTCLGDGETYSTQNGCQKCLAEKTIPHDITLSLDIKKGLRGGDQFYFKGLGNQHPRLQNGDILITLVEEVHPVFECRGDDLYMMVNIDLCDLLCGFDKVFRALDDRLLVISTLPGNLTADDDMEYAEREGMPSRDYPSVRGRLYFKYKHERFGVTPPAIIPYLSKALPRGIKLEKPPDAVEVELVSF